MKGRDVILTEEDIKLIEAAIPHEMTIDSGVRKMIFKNGYLI